MRDFQERVIRFLTRVICVYFKSQFLLLQQPLYHHLLFFIVARLLWKQIERAWKYQNVITVKLNVKTWLLFFA